jgi:hypothetical protein
LVALDILGSLTGDYLKTIIFIWTDGQTAPRIFLVHKFMTNLSERVGFVLGSTGLGSAGAHSQILPQGHILKFYLTLLWGLRMTRSFLVDCEKPAIHPSASNQDQPLVPQERRRNWFNPIPSLFNSKMLSVGLAGWLPV